jgi:hypothetical protein
MEEKGGGQFLPGAIRASHFQFSKNKSPGFECPIKLWDMQELSPTA